MGPKLRINTVIETVLEKLIDSKIDEDAKGVQISKEQRIEAKTKLRTTHFGIVRIKNNNTSGVTHCRKKVGNSTALGFGSRKKIAFLRGRSLWDLIMEDPDVKEELKTGSTIPKENSDWWSDRTKNAIKIKTKKNYSAGIVVTPVGALLPHYVSTTKRGRSMQADEDGLGLNMIFGKNTQLILSMLDAMIEHNTTDPSTDGTNGIDGTESAVVSTNAPINFPYDSSIGGYGKGAFTTAEATAVATLVMTESLQQLADYRGTTIKGILGGHSGHEFIELYGENYHRLETDVRSDIHKNSIARKLRKVEETPDDEDFDSQKNLRYEKHLGNIMFVTLANIVTNHENTIKGLLEGKLCVVVDVSQKLHIMAPAGKSMFAEHCIGSLKRNVRNLNDYEQNLKTNGSLVVELFTTAVKEEDFLLINMNATGGANTTNDKDTNDLFRSIPIENTARDATLIKLTKGKDGYLVQFTIFLPHHASTHGAGDVGGGRTVSRNRTYTRLHRLTTITANHLGFGLNKSKPFLEYLGLQEGGSIESVDRFKYHDEDNHIECGSDGIEHKKWGCTSLARFSDVDHLVGRSQLWMNSNYFIWLTSHTHNQQLMSVRKYYKNWGYGFYPFPYGNGNE